MTILAFALLIFFASLGCIINHRSAVSLRNSRLRLASITLYHGLFSLFLVFIPILILILLWLVLQNPLLELYLLRSVLAEYLAGASKGETDLMLAEIRSIASGIIFGQPEEWKLAAGEQLAALQDLFSKLLVFTIAVLALILIFVARYKVRPEFRARQNVERIVTWLMIACSVVAIFTTLGIIASLMVETGRFFSLVPITEFLFGLNWEPQIPMREDQVAAEGAFGWIPVFTGTLVITAVALFLSVPVGLMSAIYLNEFANHRVRSISKPVLEILAGVPTIVYGFFAILVVTPAFRSFGDAVGIEVSPNTALAAGGVMGIMLIPFISSFTDDALSAVPKSLRDGSLALGATPSETMLKVLFPAAIPGIVGGILLAVSRAIGETMIVVMAAGLIAKFTINPLDSVTTVTVQIVTLLIGDTSFDNPKTLAAFALGMMLFIVTLIINIFALRIVQKYREIYD
ncbi:MAG: phosphate ABC transporter permease subunit PstC [Rhodobacteraceae bacterium]|nr:phosphate ABC transporter permease subunit PstC [Paracoccaceae bacterium]MCY4250142.1 phosphate ABC transporter permease subunit PstC [Paracoccaceae bacterium]